MRQVYAYTPDGPNEIQQGKNIADAFVASGAKLLIWSTLPSIKAATEGKITGVTIFEQKYEIELYIKKLGINAVFIRIGEFFESGLLPISSG